MITQDSKPTKGMSVQPAASDVHVDFTAEFASSVSKWLLDKAGESDYQYNRAIHMSNWRAFNNPPADCPLALCDSRSVRNDGHLYNHPVFTDTVPEDFRQSTPDSREQFVSWVARRRRIRFSLRSSASLAVFCGHDTR